MARIVDAKYATLIGTAEQILNLLELMSKTAVVDLKFSNFVVLDGPLTDQQLRRALATVPEAKKGKRA